MAFYKDFEKKTRQEKRENAFARGGFDDEGSNYRSSKPRYQGKSEEKRPYGKRSDDQQRRFDRNDDRRFGDREENRDPKKRYLNGKNGYGEHMPRNQRADKPAYEKSRFGG